MANAAEQMKKYRIRHGYSIKDMSVKSGASVMLLKMLENGHVTHPKIAEQVGKAYELTREETESLMPAIHRPNDPAYEPDKYKERADGEGWKKIHFGPTKTEIVDVYIAEHAKKMKQDRLKRGRYQ